ncbi:MAG TPA: hypothetical protein VJ441_00880 [Dehalococcoidia bacterium]|nr:hypothetical protein [Dehalococcoidia bacterium]
MAGHGPYYGIPLAELQLLLEWSREEEVEIERYCEKILKNIADSGDEMTPMERFRATMEGKPRDRQFIDSAYFPLYAIRQLDSWSDALKPIDNWRYPKLVIKSFLATQARFNFDILNYGTYSYGEELWGGNARFLEYGNPVIAGERPIKSLADLEGLEIADPRVHGMFPQQLWFGRETRRIFAKYGLDKVLPIGMSFCAGPEATAWEQMMGFKEFMIGLRKNPELCKQCCALAEQWSVREATAIAEEIKPDLMYWCNIVGSFPLKGNEWLVDIYAKAAKTLAPLGIPMVLGFGFPGVLEWLPALLKGGALGPHVFGINFSEVPYKPMIDFCREHNLYCACMGPYPPSITKDGPVSAIEEWIKGACEYGKPYPRYTAMLGTFDYWTPQAHVAAAVAATKKYGKF